MTQYLNSKEDIAVAGTAMNKKEAVRLAASIDFDIALMDINLNGKVMEGIQATAEISRLAKGKVIMLTAFDDRDLIYRSFNAGAVNYINKTDYDSIPHVIRSSYKKRTPVEVLLQDYYRLRKEEQLSSLTPAEREIFNLMEEGYTQSKMMKHSFKSERTIKNQVNRILKKLGVKSSKDALEKVRRRGL